MASARLVFGLGSLHRLPTRAQRNRLLCQAFDVGFRAFDVAPAYGNGLNEIELGNALYGRRDAVRITTKFGIPVDNYGERHPVLFPMIRIAKKLLASGYDRELRSRDFSSATMRRSIDDSLRRLRTDYVDCLQIHEPFSLLGTSAMAELADCADELKRKGKIRSFGAAGPADSVRDVMRHQCIDVVQTTLRDAFGVIAGFERGLVVYGVYRRYREIGDNNSTTGFIEFVMNSLKARPGLELILASNSQLTVISFRPFFS